MNKTVEILKSLKQLCEIVEDLEKKYDRKFTLDGHTFGSIGEIYASKVYNLKLEKSSKKGFDATDENGRKVQIKVTQLSSIRLSSQPEKLLILKLNATKDGFSEIYYGDGANPWKMAVGEGSIKVLALNKLIK